MRLDREQLETALQDGIAKELDFIKNLGSKRFIEWIEILRNEELKKELNEATYVIALDAIKNPNTNWKSFRMFILESAKQHVYEQESKKFSEELSKQLGEEFQCLTTPTE